MTVLISGPEPVWFGEAYCESCDRFVGYALYDIWHLWPFTYAALPPHQGCSEVLIIHCGDIPKHIRKAIEHRAAAKVVSSGRDT